MPPLVNDNTGKVVPPNSGAPQLGQPFNYSTILDCALIPRVIYQDPKLLPGARLLWGVIRRFSFKTGKCFATDKRLAAELGVSERHIRRLSRHLVKARLLRVTDQCGKSTRRELLWAERFATPEERDTGNMSGNSHVIQDTPPIACLGRTYRSDVDGLPQTYRSGGGGPTGPGSSLYLEAPLESLSPKPPLPDSVSVCNPTYSEPGKGASEPTSARVNGPSAPRAQKTPQLPIQAEDSRGRPNPNKLRTTGDKRTHEKLIDTLYYHWATAMRTEPPIEIIDSIAKILRARHIDDTGYILQMLELIETLKDKVDDQLWLKTAAEWS